MQAKELAPWLEPVARYLELWRKVGKEEPPAGATGDEIARLLEQARLHGLHVNDQVVEFLTFVNGTSFDGCNFAGAAIPDNDVYSRSNLISYNDPDFDATSGDATVYGSRDYATFRYVASLHQFQSVDESLDVIAKFDTFGELVQHAFEQELASFPKEALT
jgi:hypothetical protein